MDAAYVPISAGEDGKGKIDPQRFAWALRGMNTIGGAISRDIKGTIAPFLDEVDPLAAAIGAVNTVVRLPDGRLAGYNTDATGFEIAVRGGLRRLVAEAWGGSPQAGTPSSAAAAAAGVTEAVVYGYGGVTAVVVAVLRTMGVRCTITGRRASAAAEVAAALGVEVFDAARHRPQLFINAAPVTNSPLADAVGFVEALNGCVVAFDHELNGTYLRVSPGRLMNRMMMTR